MGRKAEPENGNTHDTVSNSQVGAAARAPQGWAVSRGLCRETLRGVMPNGTSAIVYFALLCVVE